MSTTVISNALMDKAERCILIALLAQIAGCASPPPIDQATLNTIARCNAGYGISTGPTLSAEIARAASLGVGLSASTSSEVYGLLFSNESVTVDNVLEIYKAYLGCVNNSRSVDELLAIIKPRRDQVMELVGAELPLDAEKFDTAYNQYVEALKMDQRVAAHEALSRIYQILAVASTNLLNAGVDFSVTFSYEPELSHDPEKMDSSEEQLAKEAADLQAKTIRQCQDMQRFYEFDLDNTLDQASFCKIAHQSTN